MAEFTFRSESVDVEKIMDQIRTRIREKRGVDYTEAQIRELASVRLEKCLDPEKVRSDLLEHYGRQRSSTDHGFHPPPNFAFEDEMIYASSRGLLGRLISMSRRFLNPVLKLFFNPKPIVDVLHMQSEINAHTARYNARQFAARQEVDALNYEVLNSLVVNITRLAIDMKNQKMRLESIAGRLDFDERRARALEGVVQYRPEATAPPAEMAAEDTASGQASADGNRRRRRQRRRRRRPSATPSTPVSLEPGGDTEGSQEPQPPLAAADGDDETS